MQRNRRCDVFCERRRRRRRRRQRQRCVVGAHESRIIITARRNPAVAARGLGRGRSVERRWHRWRRPRWERRAHARRRRRRRKLMMILSRQFVTAVPGELTRELTTPDDRYRAAPRERVELFVSGARKARAGRPCRARRPWARKMMPLC